MSKTAIILSGGGITAAYCAGALLKLHKQGIQPDIIIAGSGSTGTASYFVAGQYDDISKIWFEYLSNVRFLNFFRNYNKMDISYLVDEVFKKLVPLNETNIRESEIQYHIAVTHKETGIVTYFSNKDTTASVFTYMKASMCMPLLFNDVVMIDGEQYLDGPFSASADFHIEKARELGATKIYLIDSGVRINRVLFKLYTRFVKNLFTKTQRLYLHKKAPRSYEGVMAIRRKKTSLLSMVYNSPQRIRNLFEEGSEAVLNALPIQKRVLIINNHTVHLKELCDLFSEADVVNLEDFTQDHDVSGYDGVVISGATKGMPSVYRHPEFYKEQIEFVKNATVPVVGICMGCQIVAYAYGSELFQMPQMIRGEHAIDYHDRKYKVYESHRMAIKSVSEDQFDILATSPECIEIIKHKDKPILGIQFHPEVEPQEVFKKLIEEILHKKIYNSHIIHFSDSDIFGIPQEHIDTSGFAIRPTTRILIYNKKGELLFVESKWPPHMFDLPGGGVDEGETPEDGALRECLEECGAVVKNLVFIARSESISVNRQIAFDLYYYRAEIISLGEKTTTDEREKDKQLRWFTKDEYLHYVQEFLYTKDGRKNRSMWANKYVLEQLFIDSQSDIENLYELEKTGKYLFHGSATLIEEFEPRQAINQGQKDGEPAVYASDSAEYAFFMALLSIENFPLGFKGRVKRDEHDKLCFWAIQENINSIYEKSGYVYIFNKDQFEYKRLHEYICFKSIKPLKRLFVSGDQFASEIKILD